MMVCVICALSISDHLFTEYRVWLENGKIQSPRLQKKGSLPSLSNPTFLKAHLGQKHLSGFPSKDVVIAQH